MKQALAQHTIEELTCAGVAEWVVCPGARNAPMTQLLLTSGFPITFWPEERSASFYALGRARALNKPVAVVVTSGTAAGELLPAMMEAYYSCIPLVAVTADRPKRLRGTGAPQAAEQAHLYGIYAPLNYDLEGVEVCNLHDWNQKSPLHLNLCFEDPAPESAPYVPSNRPLYKPARQSNPSIEPLTRFMQRARKPLILVSGLAREERNAVYRFLLETKAPVYLEGPSGLRDDPKLQDLRVYNPLSSDFDAVLRIGRVPTHKIWRDLEEKKSLIELLSISAQPFSGLSWAPHLHVDVAEYLAEYEGPQREYPFPQSFWEKQAAYREGLKALMEEEPFAEVSLIHALSRTLPQNTHLYLGNSLPIRSWDLVAAPVASGLEITATRGLNGIDGQIASFLGLVEKGRPHAALLGDLTTLYDFAGLWGLQYLKESDVTLYVINNGGGRIFAGMFPQKEIQNPHALNFQSFADFWKIPYQHIQEIPEDYSISGTKLVEIQPNQQASDRFRSKLRALAQEIYAVK